MNSRTLKRIERIKQQRDNLLRQFLESLRENHSPNDYVYPTGFPSNIPVLKISVQLDDEFVRLLGECKQEGKQ